VLLWSSIMLYIDKIFESNKEAGSTGDENDDYLTQDVLLLLGIVITSVWVVSMLGFIYNVKREFRGSFVNTKTTRAYVKDCWNWQMRQHPRLDDETIVKIFKKHHSVYEFFEGEIAQFVSENWEKWNHERPRFFTKKFIASIPFSVLSAEIRSEVLLLHDDTSKHEEDRERELRRVAASVV
jgi:hypothetical protein